MKFDNALELDLDALWKRKTLLDFLPGTRFILLGLGLVLLLFWGSLSLRSLMTWSVSRSLPMSEARSIKPVQLPTATTPYYSFHHVKGSFGNIDLTRIREFQKGQFENLILSSTPELLRIGLRKYLPVSLEMSQKYGVDPFWALAVMWTESHFNPSATSRVDAQGLMQIMPATGGYLVYKMANKDTVSDIESLKGLGPTELPLQAPELNMEMGNYYLNFLLHEQFSGSYRLATVAYNMGPNGVKRRLRRNLPTGVKNLYLDKVTRAYNRLTRDYRRYIASHKPPFVKTYVAQSSLRPKAPATRAPLDAFSFQLPSRPTLNKTAFIGDWSPDHSL